MALTVTNIKTVHETRDWAQYLKIVCDNNGYARGGYPLATPVGTPIVMEIISVTQGFDAAWDDTNNKMLVYRHKRAPFTITKGDQLEASAVTASLYIVPIEMSASIYEFGFVYSATSSATVGASAGRYIVRTIGTGGTIATKGTLTVVKNKARGTKTTANLTAFTVKPGWLLQFRHKRQGTGGKLARGVLYAKGRPTPSGCEALASATLSSVIVLARAVFQQI